jgi:hypothetical protein
MLEVVMLVQFAARWDAAVLARRDRMWVHMDRYPTAKKYVMVFMLSIVIMIESTLPRRSVRTFAKVLAAATLIDSAATWLWVSTGLASEGNPWVAGFFEVYGVGPGLTVRAAFSLTMIAGLEAIAKRSWEGRGAMLVAAIPLFGIVLFHLFIAGWVFADIVDQKLI